MQAVKRYVRLAAVGAALVALMTAALWVGYGSATAVFGAEVVTVVFVVSTVVARLPEGLYRHAGNAGLLVGVVGLATWLAVGGHGPRHRVGVMVLVMLAARALAWLWQNHTNDLGEPTLGRQSGGKS